MDSTERGDTDHPEQPRSLVPLRVFISHATEDKQRFVRAFATKLRAKGVDAWVDEWEMLPGDSLIRKIFTEGIGEAEAFIVVISDNSLMTPWVAEELDAAVVRKIEQEAKLIPIVLDGIAPQNMPASIRHLLFEPVLDTSSLDEVADRVVRALLGHRNKPPLGSLPFYASVHVLPGLDQLDTLILKAAGEEAVRDFGEHFKTEDFFNSIRDHLDVTESQFIESLKVLDSIGYIRINRTLGKGLPAVGRFTLTTMGFDTFAQDFVNDYDQMLEAIGAYLGSIGDVMISDATIAETLGLERMIVFHVLRIFRDQGLLDTAMTTGPIAHVFNISPRLRRRGDAG